MTQFGRNLALWAIIGLLVTVGYSFFHPVSSIPPWARSWGPYVLFSLIYLIVVAVLQRRRMKTLTARANAIAAEAHTDAQQIIALLREIKGQTPADRAAT